MMCAVPSGVPPRRVKQCLDPNQVGGCFGPSTEWEEGDHSAATSEDLYGMPLSVMTNGQPLCDSYGCRRTYDRRPGGKANLGQNIGQLLRRITALLERWE